MKGNLRFPHHCAEGVHNDKGGAFSLDFCGDLLQNRVQRFFKNDLAQIDEPDGAVQFGGIEEGKLLLVAQHLYSRFAKDGEIERRMFRRRVAEYDLMRQGRLAVFPEDRQLY